MSKLSDRRSVLIATTVIAAAAAGPAAARLGPMSPARYNVPQQPVERHFGKYRGTVVNNIDPQQRGRITAIVPAVLGQSTSAWALPCVAGAGPNAGILAVPPIGAAVWIEFEGGDPSFPIWTGGFWPQAAGVPHAAGATPGIQNIVLATATASLTVSDLPGPLGGVVLKSASGAMIAVNDAGISISNGKGANVLLVGPTVSVNNHVFT